MDKKLLLTLAGIAGIFFIILAFIYFALPANHLPHFIPGYSAVIFRHHFTHGIASLFLGLGCFAFVWFNASKKK